jgi:predicted RNA-binding protein with PUA-like domain
VVAKKEEKNYWLMKSEPDVFSIDDLEKAPGQTTHWDGVRNYQARNSMRDTMKVGDRLFFYHSNAEPSGIAGIAEIVKAGYPDFTAFDKKDVHFDPKSDKANPTWYMVDVKFVESFARILSLEDLRGIAALKNMVLLQKGSRLSVQPVTLSEWQAVIAFARKI